MDKMCKVKGKQLFGSGNGSTGGIGDMDNGGSKDLSDNYDR